MKIENGIEPQKLLAHGVRTLNRQAQKIIEQRVQQQPGSGRLWFKLGEVCRAMGALDKAALAYRQAERLDHKPSLSNYLASLFDDEDYRLPLKYPEKVEYTPTPFIHTFDFLCAQELEQVWELFNVYHTDFKPSVVGPKNQGKIDAAIRQSVFLGGSKAEKFEFILNQKLTRALKLAARYFGLSISAQSRLITQVTSHGNGNFYRVHSDHGDTYPRDLSFIYYFSEQPQRFTGGELQLLDSNLERKTYNAKSTLIFPSNNSLIVFPSRYFHQVCPINQSDMERKYSRNSINGWLMLDT